MTSFYKAMRKTLIIFSYEKKDGLAEVFMDYIVCKKRIKCNSADHKLCNETRITPNTSLNKAKFIYIT